jgi:hypothetical protein
MLRRSPAPRMPCGTRRWADCLSILACVTMVNSDQWPRKSPGYLLPGGMISERRAPYIADSLGFYRRPSGFLPVLTPESRPLVNSCLPVEALDRAKTEQSPEKRPFSPSKQRSEGGYPPLPIRAVRALPGLAELGTIGGRAAAATSQRKLTRPGALRLRGRPVFSSQSVSVAASTPSERPSGRTTARPMSQATSYQSDLVSNQYQVQRWATSAASATGTRQCATGPPADAAA